MFGNKSSNSTPNDQKHWVDYMAVRRFQWLFVVSVGGFLTLFLLFFQPFGVTNYDSNFSVDLKFIGVVIAYGSVVSGFLAINEFVLRPLIPIPLSKKSFTPWIIWNYVLVGTVVFLHYNFNGDWHDFYWSSYFGFLKDVGLVISFPILGFIYFLRHEFLKSGYANLKLTQSNLKTDKMIQFLSDSPSEKLTIRLEDLLYLKSEDNYVSVVFRENERTREKLIRASLKQLETSITEPLVLRCHRSCIVNLGRAISCQGEGHGLVVKLSKLDKPVRVSRSYQKTVLDTLKRFRV